MLVLSRLCDERIVIETSAGELIYVTLVKVEGPHKARIGVSCPKTWSIDREEVYKRKKLENAKSDSNPDDGTPLQTGHKT